MGMENMEQSRNSLIRLNSAIDELAAVIGQQKQRFAMALEEQKNQKDAAEAKVAVLESQLQALADEREKLQAELLAAQNNTDAENKIRELQAEAETRNNKMNGLQTEIQNLNTALTNRKAQIEELTAQNEALTQQLAATGNRIAELENAAAAANSADAQIQARLDEAIKQKDELAQNYQQAEQKLAEMQQTITQTTENIDDVVARLEKVLEENGASNNNN